MTMTIHGLSTELKQYIEQRIKVQTMLLLNAEIECLKARLEVAQDHCMNSAMNVECKLLTAQIEALENFRNTRI